MIFRAQLHEFTDFRAYHIDISTASIHHWVTITSRHFSRDLCAKGDLFVNMVPPDERHEDYRLVVRRLSFAEKSIESKIVMNLGSNLVRYVANRALCCLLTPTV